MSKQTDDAAIKRVMRIGLLYRYRSFPDDTLPGNEYEKQLKRTQRIFSRRKLFFPSPASFNDPFDCRADMLRYPETAEERRIEGLRILKNEHPDLPRQQIRALQRKYNKAGVFREIFEDKELPIRTQKAVNEYGVLCFSEVPDNILMWSHYTDGHKGFCLIFLAAPLVFEPEPKNPMLVPVIYNAHYPVVPIFGDPSDDELDIVFRTKSPFWQYEKEWRLVWQGGAKKSLAYPDGSLIGIILGCRIRKEHKRLMIQWTKPMTPRPMLIQARRKKQEYGLDFFLMNPKTGVEVPIDLNDLQVG